MSVVGFIVHEGRPAAVRRPRRSAPPWTATGVTVVASAGPDDGTPAPT